MKTKKRVRALAILMTLAMVFTMMPMMAQEAYAKGDSPAVVKSGNVYSFVKDAPITTVRIDGSKLKKDYAELTYQMNEKYSNNKFEWGTTSENNRDCVVINDLTTEDTSAGDDGVMQPGSFTLTYKDAAIMRDGTTKDLKVTYTPEIRMKKDTESYTDSFTIMAFQSRKPGITIQPLTKIYMHFGLIVNVACQVVDADNDDTFLLVSDEINTTRTTYDFQQIVYAGSNNNYGEAINFVSGVDSESDVYLPGESTLSTSPSDITGKNGYQVRFLATGADRESLNHVAAVASASGIQAKIWSNAGTNTDPLDLYFLDATKDVFTKEHTSSSGEGGKIELWTDGQTHNTDSESNNFRKLAGGTITTPYTYAVPYGKEVTYRMTPDEGYILDKLYVNGSETNPTNIVYKPNSTEVAYYEYHFASDSVNSDQKISVTWKKYAATKAVTTVTINSTTVSAKTLDAAVKKAGGNKDSVTTIVLGKKVKKISKGAFKNYKNAKTLVVKTKKLKKSKVKKSLKGSKITKIKVKVGKKKVNKKYVKKYKKIFTKKNAGKKVKVSL